jgi:hypothetical protein
MDSMTVKQKWIAIALLMAWMIPTRGYHYQDGTMMVMYILPLVTTSLYAFWGFAITAMAVDAYVISSNYGLEALITYCVGSPAYYYLFFAFGILFWMGSLYKRYFMGSYIAFFVLALVGTFGYEIIASGSYYWFSGDFVNPTWNAWLTNEPPFMYMFLQRSAFYSFALMLAYYVYNRQMLKQQ